MYTGKQHRILPVLMLWPEMIRTWKHFANHGKRKSIFQFSSPPKGLYGRPLCGWLISFWFLQSHSIWKLTYYWLTNFNYTVSYNDTNLTYFYYILQFTIETDNSGLVWAYKKGRSRTCPYLNMFLESINYVALMYSVTLYIRHVNRKTTQVSACADALTRDDKDM